MSLEQWLGHELVSVLSALIVLGFAASVLVQRRPAGSAFAWLLAIVLMPYVGVPLYLVFGGRKFRKRALEKKRVARSLALKLGSAPEPVGAGYETRTSAPVWLDDGLLAYRTFLEEIRAAKRSIRIVTFVIGDDETGRSLLEALSERAEQGVEVRLLLDDLLHFHAPRQALARLTAAGGRTGRFMPLLHLPFRGRTNLRNHRKIAVFDGERAIVGGMNLAREYMGPTASSERWRDLSLAFGGQAASVLDAIFRADWEFATGEVLTEPEPCDARGETPLQIVPSGPDAPNDPLYDALLTAIFRAEQRVWVATPYFVPDEPLSRALAVAARRGVDVRVVVPARSNHLLADWVGAPYLRELAAAGVQVRRYPSMLHAKAVLVDGALASVGSANFDMRSLLLDYEIALFWSGSAEVERLARWFSETFARAELGAPPATRLRAALEQVARLLSPLI